MGVAMSCGCEKLCLHNWKAMLADEVDGLNNGLRMTPYILIRQYAYILYGLTCCPQYMTLARAIEIVFKHQ